VIPCRDVSRSGFVSFSFLCIYFGSMYSRSLNIADCMILLFSCLECYMYMVCLESELHITGLCISYLDYLLKVLLGTILMVAI
jgi:hypothetical protein